MLSKNIFKEIKSDKKIKLMSDKVISHFFFFVNFYFRNQYFVVI